MQSRMRSVGIALTMCVGCVGKHDARFPPLQADATALEITDVQLRSAVRLELAEDFEIPSAKDGALSFTEITSVAPASNGGIYVLDGHEKNVIAVDSTGRLVRRIGRVRILVQSGHPF